MDRGAWRAMVHGVRHDLVTEQQQQEMCILIFSSLVANGGLLHAGWELRGSQYPEFTAWSGEKDPTGRKRT